MTKLIPLLLTLLCLALSSPAFASPELNAEFSSSFLTGYKKGRCGENIANLLKRAQEKGIDIAQAHAVVLTNGGYLMSTLFARNEGEKLPAPQGEFKFAPGINNFYFHVVLEKDGQIYDYDFGNEPRVLPLKDYIRLMFWEEPSKTEYTGMESLVWRKKYKIAFVPATQYLEKMNAEGVQKYVLEDFYNSL